MIPKYVHDMNVEKERIRGAALMRSNLTSHAVKTSMLHNAALYGTIANNYYIDNAIEHFVRSNSFSEKPSNISEQEFIRNKKELFAEQYPSYAKVPKPNFIKIVNDTIAKMAEEYPSITNEPFAEFTPSEMLIKELMSSKLINYLNTKKSLSIVDLIAIIQTKFYPLYLISTTTMDIPRKSMTFVRQEIPLEFFTLYPSYNTNYVILSFIEIMAEDYIYPKVSNKDYKTFVEVIIAKKNYYSNYKKKLTEVEEHRLILLNGIYFIYANFFPKYKEPVIEIEEEIMEPEYVPTPKSQPI